MNAFIQKKEWITVTKMLSVSIRLEVLDVFAKLASMGMVLIVKVYLVNLNQLNIF
jgi:hypothetical protein